MTCLMLHSFFLQLATTPIFKIMHVRKRKLARDLFTLLMHLYNRAISYIGLYLCIYVYVYV